jgi:hypothetical protein
MMIRKVESPCRVGQMPVLVEKLFLFHPERFRSLQPFCLDFPCRRVPVRFEPLIALAIAIAVYSTTVPSGSDAYPSTLSRSERSVLENPADSAAPHWSLLHRATTAHDVRHFRLKGQVRLFPYGGQIADISVLKNLPLI